MLKAILIDVGGTLVDEDEFFRQADQLIMSEVARARKATTPEEYERILISYTKRCFPNPREVTLWHLLRPDLAEFKRVRELLQQLVQEWTASAVRPEAAAAVAALAKGKDYKLALAGKLASQGEGTPPEGGDLGTLRLPAGFRRNGGV